MSHNFNNEERETNFNEREKYNEENLSNTITYEEFDTCNYIILIFLLISCLFNLKCNKGKPFYSTTKSALYVRE